MPLVTETDEAVQPENQWGNNNSNRKTKQNKTRKEGRRKEGSKEGSKEVRKEGRKEGRQAKENVVSQLDINLRRVGLTERAGGEKLG